MNKTFLLGLKIILNMTETVQLVVRELPRDGYIHGRIEIPATGEYLAKEEYDGEAYPNTPLDAVNYKQPKNVENPSPEQSDISIEYDDDTDLLKITPIINNTKYDTIKIAGKHLSIIQL